MSIESNLTWVREHLQPEDVVLKDVLEVGSRCWPFPPDITRDEPVITDYLRSLCPASLIGTDILAGKNVTQVLAAENLVQHFGMWSFDTVVCLEVLEHVERWQLAVENMLAVLKPLGAIYLTTRMPGYPRHDYPHDFWRFDRATMSMMFGACDLLVEEDVCERGIYVRARKKSVAAVGVE